MKSTRRCPSKADAVERTRLFGRWQLKETSQRDLDESLFGYVLQSTTAAIRNARARSAATDSDNFENPAGFGAALAA